MTENQIHVELSNIKIDKDNLDYIKLCGEITGNLRWDLVKLFSTPSVNSKREFLITFLEHMDKVDYTEETCGMTHKELITDFLKQ